MAPPRADGPQRHGTRSTYVNWACRCGPCRAANTAYTRAAQARRAARRQLDADGRPVAPDAAA